MPAASVKKSKIGARRFHLARTCSPSHSESKPSSSARAQIARTRSQARVALQPSNSSKYPSGGTSPIFISVSLLRPRPGLRRRASRRAILAADQALGTASSSATADGIAVASASEGGGAAGRAPAGAGRPVAWRCSIEPSRRSAKWHATRWADAASRSAGSTVRHSSGRPRRSYSQQRVWKRQPLGRVERARDVAAEDDPAPMLLDRRVRDRDGRQQCHRVRVERAAVELGGGGDLDDAPEVHHRDAVADVANRGEVVRDDEIRQTRNHAGAARAGSGSGRGSRRRAR